MADYVYIGYEVIEKHGVLSESTKGWTKELRSISWNGREPKFDVREWSPEGDKMGKGVTLSKDDLISLKRILNGMGI